MILTEPTNIKRIINWTSSEDELREKKETVQGIGLSELGFSCLGLSGFGGDQMPESRSSSATLESNIEERKREGRGADFIDRKVSKVFSENRNTKTCAFYSKKGRCLCQEKGGLILCGTVYGKKTTPGISVVDHYTFCLCCLACFSLKQKKKRGFVKRVSDPPLIESLF